MRVRGGDGAARRGGLSQLNPNPGPNSNPNPDPKAPTLTLTLILTLTRRLGPARAAGWARMRARARRQPSRLISEIAFSACSARRYTGLAG